MNPPLDPKIYIRVFEDSPDGVAILEELARIFVRPPRMSGGIDGILTNYRSMGERAVIDFILGRINKARNPDWADEEGDA